MNDEMILEGHNAQAMDGVQTTLKRNRSSALFKWD